MATHSSILAWRIPWTEEPGGLQSIGSQSQTQLKRLSPHSRRLGGPGEFEKRWLERPIMVSKDTGELLKVTTKNRNRPWLSQAPDWEPSRA